MPDRHLALTPEALQMLDTIARSGSFAAAARELGKVPSALTYSVRQLEEALDVLLFDRSSRQAQLTAAGGELLHEGRRLLQEMDAVANRVRRVAHGWESQLSIGVDDALSLSPLLDLAEAFYALRAAPTPPARARKQATTARAAAAEPPAPAPATRLRLRTDVMAGTWEGLVHGQVDLAVGVDAMPHHAGIEREPLGELPFVFCVAPQHPLAQATEPLTDAQLVHHRAVAVADTAQRLTPMTVHLLPGQDVLTVPHGRAKLEALLRGLGAGFIPQPLAHEHVRAGRLRIKAVARGNPRPTFHYAWRAEHGPRGLGRALQWWLEQLARPATRRALLQAQAVRPG
jgi:DNA-binding transcriptional LysR family regulator